jgi:carbon-monoxide dehydrogenase medium subunit
MSIDRAIVACILRPQYPFGGEERHTLAMQTPAPCDYSRATSVDDAIAQLQAKGGNARILAGGYSLIPMMKLRLANPGHVIDINPLESELSYIRKEGNEIRIGALTRHVAMLKSELLAQTFPDIFQEAEAVLADPVVRNRGTMGGSVCQADPAEDLSGVVTALHGVAVIRGPGGAERLVGMEEFHLGPYMTAVGSTEMLTEVRFPIQSGRHGSAHEKVERRAGDFAIVAASGSINIEGGVISHAGLACSAVGPTTIHVERAEQMLVGQAPSEQLFAQAGQMAAADCSPNSDGRGTADYKRHVAGVLSTRALSRAAAKAMR